MGLNVPNEPFITGTGFAHLCEQVVDWTIYAPPAIRYNEDAYIKNSIYIKTDYIEYFFKAFEWLIKPDSVIITGKSDLPIDYKHIKYIEHPHVKRWYATNVTVSHRKLWSIPLGLENNVKIDVMRTLVEYPPEKRYNLYFSFYSDTNPKERLKCIANAPIHNSPREPFDVYMNKMASSYFTLSPNGNGVDCHRHWEALYVKTIPIVTKSLNVSYHQWMPFLVLKNWDELSTTSLSPDLYFSIWDDFNVDRIYLEQYIKRKIK